MPIRKHADAMCHRPLKGSSYQNALFEITADTVGFTRLALDLGPFGGAQSLGALLWPWPVVYVLIVGVLAVRAFARRDL